MNADQIGVENAHQNVGCVSRIGQRAENVENGTHAQLLADALGLAIALGELGGDAGLVLVGEGSVGGVAHLGRLELLDPGDQEADLAGRESLAGDRPGRENAKLFLKQNPGVAKELEDKIRGANGLDFNVTGSPENDDLVDM